MTNNFDVKMDEYLPLRDVVFKTLRQAILKGELEPGERLMEIQLAERLGVSRTPIREAIRKLELEGVLLTMYDGRLNLTQQVVAEVKKFFPRKVFATAIPRSVRLSEAPSFGKPINYYDRGSKGAEAYDALARELTGTPSARR